MFVWKKLGRVFGTDMVKDKWWMVNYTQTPSVVVFDDFVRVYYCCRPHPDSNGQFVSYLAFFDLDKKDMQTILKVADRPLMSLGDLGTFDEFGIYPASVIRHNNDFRVYYGGNTRCVSVPFNAAIGVGISTNNGLSFERIGNGPVLSYSPDEPFVLGSPKIRNFNNKWYLWYAAGCEWIEQDGLKQPVYKIRCAVSEDGFEWEKFGKNLLPDLLEKNECQASPDVFFYNGKYHMFYSYRYNFGYKEKGKGYRVGYAFSSNLEEWTRADHFAAFEPTAEGWDSETVSYLHVFQSDDNFYAFYQGNFMGREGIGLAKLEGIQN
jgi:hypothetical protein